MAELRYICPDQKLGVVISDDIFKYIFSECRRVKRRETGGILIGNYSLDLQWANLTVATGPTVDSKKGNSNFYRGIKGLKERLDYEWEDNKCFYIGEWHYHPGASPVPSSPDITQMIQLSHSTTLKCPEPILIVIGGNDRLGWKYSVNIIKNTKWVNLLKL